jgi:purine nucleoside permease
MKFALLHIIFFATVLTSVLAQRTEPAISPKVFVITMFDIPVIGGETLRWIENENLQWEIEVPGLSPKYPTVRCRHDKDGRPHFADLCVVTTDETFANAGPSVMAIIFGGKFNLEHTYFIVAGIAGVDPADGTLGSAAWARYVINYGTSHEIDAREMPADWPYGYTGFGPVPPGVYPSSSNWIGVEVYTLNEVLLQQAVQLTQNLDLTVNDNPTAAAYRNNYPNAPANQPPKVIQCDSAAVDTWWHGVFLSQRANDWTTLLTNGTGNYCMTNEEDSATMSALMRGANAGLLDFNRVAVLRTASNFDQPYPGQTAWDSLQANSGGFFPACANAYLVGSTLAREIIHRWEMYQNHIPPHLIRE